MDLKENILRAPRGLEAASVDYKEKHNSKLSISQLLSYIDIL